MTNFKGILPASVFTAIAFTGITVPAHADLSANVGFASDYYFRGILQKNSSASAGLDFEQNGFYVGTWAADVYDGLEVDLYGGYGMELEGGISLGIGFTGYYYTGDFDDTYEEINLSAGWGPFSIGYNIGEYDNFGGPSQDYDFLELSVEQNGFYGTYGTFGDDFDGDYFEFGYGTEIGGFDAGVALILSSDDLAPTGVNEDDEALVFTLGKTFDL